MSLQPLPDPAAIARAAELIESADALIIAAGAGMGVDSGLPDFRGNEGFWKAYPALARARLEFTRIASPSAFERNPQLAWVFYGHRLKLYRDTPTPCRVRHPQRLGRVQAQRLGSVHQQCGRPVSKSRVRGRPH